MATDTKANPFTGQAGAFLQCLLDAEKVDSIADRDDLLKEIKRGGHSCVLFKLFSDSEVTDLLLFEDGSGFCASDDSGYKPWPVAWISNDQIDLSEFTPRFEKAAQAIDFNTNAFKIYSRDEAYDIEGVEAWFSAIAAEMPDPPEALRDLLVANEQEAYWEDHDGMEYAQSLIIDFVSYYLPARCNIAIRTNNDAGRPPAQKRYEESMCKQLNEMNVGYGTRFERDAMYSGAAYAEVEEVDGVDYAKVWPINGALAWFSQRLLEKYGRPVGWETNYNDGAYDRMSGYSANAEAIYLEIEQPASNHYRVGALPRLRAFLAQEGLIEAFDEVCDEVKVPRLPAEAPQEARA